MTLFILRAVWRRVPRSVLAAAVVLAVGVWAGHRWWPRIVRETVDREIVRTVERLVPGERQIVHVPVPGPVQYVRVPVEVTREVIRWRDRPVERIVTVTRPVDVPVEVVRQEWPQTITVRVGGVLVEGVWRAPDYPMLTLGQVTPGVYAVPAQPGWRVEHVETVTRMEPTMTPAWTGLRGPALTVGVLGHQPFAGITYTNRAGGTAYTLAAGYGFPGAVAGVFVSIPLGR